MNFYAKPVFLFFDIEISLSLFLKNEFIEIWTMANRIPPKALIC